MTSVPVRARLVPHRRPGLAAALPVSVSALASALARTLAKTTAAPLLAATVLLGCAHDPDRLPELDRRFYENLPTGVEQQEFLRVKPSQRQAYLEDKGLWDQWEALPKAEREAAARGEVELGFHEFALYMAWGPPADTQDRDANGRPLQLHTFIRCSSGPKRGRYVRSNLDCDGTSSETQVSIRDGLVVEIVYPN